MNKGMRLMVPAMVFALVSFVSFDLGAAGQTEGAEAQQHVIQVGHIHPVEYSAHKALEAFADYVAENTNDTVRVEIFPNGTLGSEKQQIERTMLGTQDASLGYSGALQPYDSAYGIFSVYFLWDNYDVMLRVFNGPVGQEIVEGLAQKGLRLLGPIVYAGERYLTTKNTPVRTPEDLRGVKTRSVEDPIAMAFHEAMGATPTPIAFNELYMALQQGIVQGQDNGLTVIWLQKFYEQQKYVMHTNLKFTDHVLLINEKKFQSLSPDQQKVLIDAANTVWAPEVRRMTEADEKVLIDQLKEQGMEFIVPDREAFRARAIEKAYELEERNMWPKGLLDKVLEEIQRTS